MEIGCLLAFVGLLFVVPYLKDTTQYVILRRKREKTLNDGVMYDDCGPIAFEAMYQPSSYDFIGALFGGIFIIAGISCILG
jgi:hypothetical protein